MRHGLYGLVWGVLLVGCFVDQPAATSVTSTASASATTSSSSETSTASASGSSSGSSSSGESSESGESSSTSETSETSTTGGCPPCTEPPSACHHSPGSCVDGACVYDQVDPDTACDDGDPCTLGDLCDEAGSCVGAAMECAQPNATGTCADGSCGAWECLAEWGNCDGDWDNGCEVPVGVANQCDIDGLTPDGCWTAYCGSSESDDAVNFGDFYCVSCVNCTAPGEGLVQWCSHSAGVWFDAGDGVCPAKDEHMVCVP